VHGIANGTGSGVWGDGGTNGTGVTGNGAGNGVGVIGHGGTYGGGVIGYGGSGGSGTTGVYGAGGAASGTGVEGTGSGSGAGVIGNGGSSDGTGVTGNGYGNGTGVVGASHSGWGVFGYSFGGAGTAGVGVRAENESDGNALEVEGKAAFSRSGLLTVPAGSAKATQTGVALTSASLMLATLQRHQSGLYVLAAVPNVSGSSFTVYLSQNVSASTSVAWFIIN
jgi:hypothetical protein